MGLQLDFRHQGMDAELEQQRIRAIKGACGVLGIRLGYILAGSGSTQGGQPLAD